MFATLVVLASGAGMAAHYLQPDTPIVPDRISTNSIRPAQETNLPAPAAAAIQPAAITTMEPVPAPTPPTVALPSGPLLRSATDAPPIDTSSLDPAMPVRHDPDASLGPSAQPAAFPDPAPSAIDTQPAPLSRPASTRRPRPQPTTVHANRQLEKLFLNPLGVR